ncbi:PIG-L family deacetylase [Candidatus Nitrospira salsa]
MMSSDITKNSILVVAHPDDEILWFSSILLEMDHVVLCFLGELVNPEFGLQRKQILPDYPLKQKMSCLELVSLGLSRPRNFLNPKFSEYGIEFTDNKGVDGKFTEHYEENYRLLRNHLAQVLVGYQHVFTHNPWGEYGHEEHVQVYRVIQELQKDLGYTIVYSNYCSNRTVHLTSLLVNACEVGSRPTDQMIARKILDVYERTNTWTWYDDWQWPAQETFFQEMSFGSTGISPGALLPVNMIVMPDLPPLPVVSESRARRLRRFLGV